ncbi:MAG: hypothetical protein J5I59_05730 [Saprospiraceae bacterium]|nr:hypothetical protein [Saprospiraceae bacterium]
MKKILLLLSLLLFFSSCNKGDDQNTNNNTEFRQEMRDFVISISQYAKATIPDFLIIPQNGIELVTHNGEVTGQPALAYLNAIDANGQEDLFYGYDYDDKPHHQPIILT